MVGPVICPLSPPSALLDPRACRYASSSEHSENKIIKCRVSIIAYSFSIHTQHQHMEIYFFFKRVNRLQIILVAQIKTQRLLSTDFKSRLSDPKASLFKRPLSF